VCVNLEKKVHEIRHKLGSQYRAIPWFEWARCVNKRSSLKCTSANIITWIDQCLFAYKWLDQELGSVVKLENDDVSVFNCSPLSEFTRESRERIKIVLKHYYHAAGMSLDSPGREMDDLEGVLFDVATKWEPVLEEVLIAFMESKELKVSVSANNSNKVIKTVYKLKKLANHETGIVEPNNLSRKNLGQYWGNELGRDLQERLDKQYLNITQRRINTLHFKKIQYEEILDICNSISIKNTLLEEKSRFLEELMTTPSAISNQDDIKSEVIQVIKLAINESESEIKKTQLRKLLKKIQQWDISNKKNIETVLSICLSNKTFPIHNIRKIKNIIGQDHGA
jgi:hypothetical protein